ncbi:MAG: hypothetical protein PHD27_05475 [Eubacteriales bacterium]|nr:hypothetical protein [Eubacteriales bacterium]
MKRFAVVFLSLCLAYAGTPLALGQQTAPVIELKSQQAGSSGLSYPYLTGLPNLFVQDKINLQISEKGSIVLHEATLNSPLLQGAQGVKVWSEQHILSSVGVPAILSVVIFAEGKMPGGRLGYEATPMMFDLATGDEILSDALWTSREEAQEFFDKWVEEESSLNLNTYIDPDSALPVPIDYAVLTPYGVDVHYPPNTYTLLSDRSGVFSFYFHEIKTILNTAESSLLHRLDILADSQVTLLTKEKVMEAVAGGWLPGIGQVIGRKIDDVVAQYKELTDNEAFLSGEMYVLEDARFRDIFLTVLDGTTVEGILARRMNLFGLVTGATTRQTCIEILAEPLMQITLDEPLARQYAMQTGTAALYRAGSHTLMLAFDAGDVLHTVYLALAE